MLFYIIISVLIIMLASLSGILFIENRMKVWVNRHLPKLLAFAVGVFIATTLSLLKESSEHAHALETGIYVLLGIIFMSIFFKIIPDTHHHHETETGHPHSKIDARKMLFGDAVHNIGDGLLIVPAFMLGTHVGILTTLAIFIHEFVQEIAEFFVLKSAGYSTREALAKNFLVSSSIIIGVILSLTLSTIHGIEILLISFTAGCFIYILSKDLIPNTLQKIKHTNRKSPYIVSLLIGFALISILNAALPHGHEEVENDNHEESISS